MAMEPAELAEEIRRQLDKRPALRKRVSVLSAYAVATAERRVLRTLDEELVKRQDSRESSSRRPSDTGIQCRYVLKVEDIAPAEVAFWCESQLVDLVDESIGRELPLEQLKRLAREHHLPSGRRIDLLCAKKSIAAEKAR